jgi:thiamine biosynthesis lipoprotein
LERVEFRPVTTESLRVGRRSYKVTSGRPAMGTFVSLTVLASSPDRAQEAIGRAFGEMERLIGILSRHDPKSAVSYLNERGQIAGPPPEVSHLVSRSLLYHRWSQGAFDASVKPLIDLFESRQIGGNSGGLRDDDVLEALERVGSRYIDISARAVRFERPGMGITLDGIAKGYIVDRIADVLTRQGLESYLINAGGDIRTAGTKEKRRPWTVAVQDPAKKGDFPDVIRVRKAAIATSGSYEIHFDRQQILHHIVNSSTGASADSNKSVSVIAPTALAADALATAVFVMEPTLALELIGSLRGCECLIIDTLGRQLRSDGWRSVEPKKGKGREDE